MFGQYNGRERVARPGLIERGHQLDGIKERNRLFPVSQRLFTCNYPKSAKSIFKFDSIADVLSDLS